MKVMPSIYCVRMEPDENGALVYRNIDIEEEVLFMGVTPKSIKGKKTNCPPGVPIFVTREGDFLQLVSMESYLRPLKEHGFDLFNPSNLVNVALVDYIEIGQFGNEAHFKGCDISVPVSRPKTDEYKHLVAKRFSNLPKMSRG